MAILTAEQIKALKSIAASPLSKHFYFSGGTALAHFYLQHRYSEDLDFFSEQEFDTQSVTVALKSIQPSLGFSSIDFQNSFNRNLYFLLFKSKKILKLEFTYFPFQQVEPPTSHNGLLVDSVVDIATNKLFTIVQNPRGRDYYDLFAIIKKYGFSLEQLRKLAKQKFDWHIDPLHMASRLHEVDQHLDDPILTKQIKRSELVLFFQHEALAFKDQILEA